MTKTESDPEQLAAEARTEADEIKDDIKETRTEAAEARKEGDTSTAQRLEKKVTALETKLDGVMEKLTTLVDRPFHAAPEEKPPAEEKPAAGTDQAGDEKQDQEHGQEPGGAGDKLPRGRYSRRWFGNRDDED